MVVKVGKWLADGEYAPACDVPNPPTNVAFLEYNFIRHPILRLSMEFLTVMAQGDCPPSTGPLLMSLEQIAYDYDQTDGEDDEDDFNKTV